MILNLLTWHQPNGARRTFQDLTSDLSMALVSTAPSLEDEDQLSTSVRRHLLLGCLDDGCAILRLPRIPKLES